MGLLHQVGDDKKGDVKSVITGFYTGNKKFVNGVAWSLFLIACLKGSAIYLQKQ